MLSTPNGCLCHRLEGGQTCIACRGRQKRREEGHSCKKCGVGLFEREEEEHDERLCTECYYDRHGGGW